jgi:hypothetical protein
MIDPLSRVGRELKTADDFFKLAKNASSPFMRAYYRRVAERYLGELKPMKSRTDVARSDASRTDRESSLLPLSLDSSARG